MHFSFATLTTNALVTDSVKQQITFSIQFGFVDDRLAIVAVQPTGSERRLWVDYCRFTPTP